MNRWTIIFVLNIIIIIVISTCGIMVKAEKNHSPKMIPGYHYNTEKFLRKLLKLVPNDPAGKFMKRFIPIFHHHHYQYYQRQRLHRTINQIEDAENGNHKITLIKHLDLIIQNAIQEINHLKSVGKFVYIQQMYKFIEHIQTVRQQIIDDGCDQYDYNINSDYNVNSYDDYNDDDDDDNDSSICSYYNDIVIAFEIELNKKIKHFG
uniref:Uncharacterized protein LOC113796597 n=1 Tax=Dermatophagoides pteronyssinus TaxID=6956 RepID=A0A6P6YCQ3_DERPT|nr:uncharacterized protein LOC113796597 [Dermatophagoides pteronyssinus]